MYTPRMEAKYDKIGKDYNQTRKADPYLVNRLFTLLSPKKEANYLDIGCGTGNYTNELYERGVAIMGIDPSKEMLEKARRKNPVILWKVGTAENTGLETDSMDGIIGSLTIHHWTDLKLAFHELKRILKPTGNLVLFTSTAEQMKGYWLNHYFPNMLNDSIRQMPSLVAITEAMEAANFHITTIEKYAIQDDLKDLFLYSGKTHPEYYLNPKIRQGISSFSDLAHEKEVQAGLEKLKNDIASEKIHPIIESYANDNGDYLFIKANPNSLHTKIKYQK